MEKTSLALLLLLSASAVVLFNYQPEAEKVVVDDFYRFKSRFKKTYENEAEEIYRKGVFLENMARIESHNSNPQNTHSLGVTQFADLTQTEFMNTHLGGAQVNTAFMRIEEEIQEIRSHLFKDDIDWSAEGKTSPVKNQGQCGSCWAFSTTGSIQSAFRIRDGQSASNLVLSEQQLVDCSSPYGNHGCSGGWVDSGYQYVVEHGLTTEQNYPYSSRDSTCKVDGGPYKISKFVDVPGCIGLFNALRSQPVSVAVDASTWSLYSGGVMSQCGKGVNHAVLAVGIVDGSWKVKNSWGTAWGENGFIRLMKGNTCGICTYPSYPVL